MHKSQIRKWEIFYLLLALLSIYTFSILASGCAQIIAPSGGTKDTIPPELLSSTPANGATNFRGNKITLNFDEFVIVEQVQENLLVSPAPNINPYIDYKLRSVTIKLKDSLQENTTYVINLGNAIRDLNESNQFKDFKFVFSTGPVIDSLTLSGKVILAETGLTDSTMFALLYKNMDDSAVQKLKPSFISRINANGEYQFGNLPPGSFKLYALRDKDNGRTYNNLTEVFAFADKPVVVDGKTPAPMLYAFQERKDVTPVTSGTRDKVLKYVSKVPGSRQDITDPLIISFNFPIANFDKQKIILADTLNVPLSNTTVSLDSTGKIISLTHPWVENTAYRLIIDKELGKDSTGKALAKTDTLKFFTKAAEDYGSLSIRFSNLPRDASLVLQFVSGNDVSFSAPLTGNTYTNNIFKPGEYGLRILIDENKNGKWDAGSYSKKQQPEHVIAIKQPISIRKNFENELEIKL